MMEPAIRSNLHCQSCHAMPFRFQKASCVVAGTFNMYILHPQWLEKHGIIEKGTEVFLESNLSRPGFRFRFSKQRLVWAVAPDRIVVESERPEVDCGKPVASVLKALPETPIFGIGNNVTYMAGRDELDTLASRIRDFPKPELQSEGQSIAQQTFHFSVKRSDHDFINVQLSVTEDKLELSCNAHTKLDNPARANREAVGAAELFFQDRQASEQLAQQLIGATIDHDLDDLGAGNSGDG
jgi:hypothetical protein